MRLTRLPLMILAMIGIPLCAHAFQTTNPNSAIQYNNANPTPTVEGAPFPNGGIVYSITGQTSPNGVPPRPANAIDINNVLNNSTASPFTVLRNPIVGVVPSNSINTSGTGKSTIISLSLGSTGIVTAMVSPGSWVTGELITIQGAANNSFDNSVGGNTPTFTILTVQPDGASFTYCQTSTAQPTCPYPPPTTPVTTGGVASVYPAAATATWAGNVATITTSTPVNWVSGQTVLISGMSPSAYNGVFAITGIGTGASSTTNFTYSLPETTSPGAGTGGAALMQAASGVTEPAWFMSNVGGIRYLEAFNTYAQGNPDTNLGNGFTNAQYDWLLNRYASPPVYSQSPLFNWNGSLHGTTPEYFTESQGPFLAYNALNYGPIWGSYPSTTTSWQSCLSALSTQYGNCLYTANYAGWSPDGAWNEVHINGGFDSFLGSTAATPLENHVVNANPSNGKRFVYTDVPYVDGATNINSTYYQHQFIRGGYNYTWQANVNSNEEDYTETALHQGGGYHAINIASPGPGDNFINTFYLSGGGVNNGSDQGTAQELGDVGESSHSFVATITSTSTDINGSSGDGRIVISNLSRYGSNNVNPATGTHGGDLAADGLYTVDTTRLYSSGQILTLSPPASISYNTYGAATATCLASPTSPGCTSSGQTQQGSSQLPVLHITPTTSANWASLFDGAPVCAPTSPAPDCQVTTYFVQATPSEYDINPTVGTNWNCQTPSNTTPWVYAQPEGGGPNPYIAEQGALPICVQVASTIGLQVGMAGRVISAYNGGGTCSSDVNIVAIPDMGANQQLVLSGLRCPSGQTTFGVMGTISISDPGFGQTDITTTINADPASRGGGASIQIVISGGQITSATIVSRGSGYALPPTFTLPKGGSTGKVVSTIETVGSVLTAGQSLLSFGPAAGLALAMQVDSRWGPGLWFPTLYADTDNSLYVYHDNNKGNVLYDGLASRDTTSNIAANVNSAVTVSGALSSVTIATPGSGQSDGPQVIQGKGGGGSGASIVVNIVDGALVSAYIQNIGSGYTSAPIFQISEGGMPGMISAAINQVVTGLTLASDCAGGPCNGRYEPGQPFNPITLVQGTCASQPTAAFVTDPSYVSTDGNPLVAVSPNITILNNGGSGCTTVTASVDPDIPNPYWLAPAALTFESWQPPSSNIYSSSAQPNWLELEPNIYAACYVPPAPPPTPLPAPDPAYGCDFPWQSSAAFVSGDTVEQAHWQHTYVEKDYQVGFQSYMPSAANNVISGVEWQGNTNGRSGTFISFEVHNDNQYYNDIMLPANKQPTAVYSGTSGFNTFYGTQSAPYAAMHVVGDYQNALISENPPYTSDASDANKWGAVVMQGMGSPYAGYATNSYSYFYGPVNGAAPIAAIEVVPPQANYVPGLYPVGCDNAPMGGKATSTLAPCTQKYPPYGRYIVGVDTTTNSMRFLLNNTSGTNGELVDIIGAANGVAPVPIQPTLVVSDNQSGTGEIEVKSASGSSMWSSTWSVAGAAPTPSACSTPGSIFSDNDAMSGTLYVCEAGSGGAAWTAVGSGGGSGGITALTGDVSASGTGSVMATVTGIEGTPVSSTAPSGTQGLFYDGSSQYIVGWADANLNPMSLTGDGGCVYTNAMGAITEDPGCTLDGSGDLESATMTASEISASLDSTSTFPSLINGFAISNMRIHGQEDPFVFPSPPPTLTIDNLVRTGSVYTHDPYDLIINNGGAYTDVNDGDFYVDNGATVAEVATLDDGSGNAYNFGSLCVDGTGTGACPTTPTAGSISTNGSLSLGGTLTSYNGNATAGVGQPIIVNSGSLTESGGGPGGLPCAGVTYCPAGLYRLQGYVVSQGGGTGLQVSYLIQYWDGTARAMQTLSVGPLAASTAGAKLVLDGLVFQTDGLHAISVTTSTSSGTGTATWTEYWVMERIQ